METITGYAVAKKVNELLTAEGLKTIPPQMVYNYIKKGLIPSIDGRVTIEAAAEFATKYITKKTKKVLEEV